MLMSSWAIRRLTVSSSCLLAWMMSELERRSAMMSGRRSPAGGAGAPGAGGAVGDERATRRDERAQERGEVGHGRVAQRNDLRDDLVRDPGRVGLLADDRRHRALARALDTHDLVEVAGLDRREAVHLQDREQDAEDVLLRDAPGGLHGHLAADVRRQHVVEADDLARGLDR